jgi:predicted nucleic acid-binding protein
LIVADSSLIYALLDRADANHGDATAWYETQHDELVTTPLVLTELDYLAMRLGTNASAALYRDLVDQAYTVEWWPGAAAESAELALQHAELQLGLVDASLVLLAERFSTTSVATFDHRHFRVVRPVSGADAFTLLPADA